MKGAAAQGRALAAPTAPAAAARRRLSSAALAAASPARVRVAAALVRRGPAVGRPARALARSHSVAAAGAAWEDGAAAAPPPPLPPPPRALLIDNYDSYTYNLFQLIAEIYGVPPLVLRNDEATADEIEALLRSGAAQHVVLSPGPGRPQDAADIGVCIELLHRLHDVPILGVCLGHQALAVAHGGDVVRAPEPVHGRLSELAHTGHALFAGCPSGAGAGFAVVRYHSLIADPATLPACLEPIAWTEGPTVAVALKGDSSSSAAAAAAPRPGHSQPGDSNDDSQHGRLLMAVAHRSRPHYGVQFHPESIASGFGPQLLANFRDLGLAAVGRPAGPAPRNARGPPGGTAPPRPWPGAPAAGAGGARPPLRLAWRRVRGALGALGGDARPLFESLVLNAGSGDGNGNGKSHNNSNNNGTDDTFWLDSSATDRARFSFMGGRGGPLWRRVTYRLPPPSAPPPERGAAWQPPPRGAAAAQAGELLVTRRDGSIDEVESATIWAYLERELDAMRAALAASDDNAGNAAAAADSDAGDGGLAAAADALPFDFWGGYVGYLGYELKAECGGSDGGVAAPTPDAALFLADRLVAVDHHAASGGDVYALALYDADGAAEADAWLSSTVARITGRAANAAAAAADSALPQQLPPPPPPPKPAAATTGTAPRFALAHGRAAYEANVRSCQAALRAGDSYELCLTTAITRCVDGNSGDAPLEPWPYYKTLRSVNPAPYAAWLSFAPDVDARPGGGGAVALCCSSPERFLRGSRGAVLEAKPIKGTAPRDRADPARDTALAANLAACEKERAENLMIVDLLRNDLGRVCVPGSVHVPGLIEVESYATVHQLVSTVRGVRAPGVGAVAAVRAAFPGGSMTGAPKVRSMAILDALERRARGPYSGSAGFFSVNDTFDLNIVIRTAVFYDDDGGAGGGGGGAYGAGEARKMMSIGAGGAVVVQSDAAAEYQEMRLKASALLRAAAAAEGRPAGGAEADVDERSAGDTRRLLRDRRAAPPAGCASPVVADESKAVAGGFWKTTPERARAAKR